jgi:integrase/recombinase XerD
MKHIKEMGDDCRAVLMYAGETDEYWAFLTPEATKYLEDYFDQRKRDGEKFYPETPIFRMEYRLGIEKPIQAKRDTVIGVINRLVKTANIKRQMVNSKNYDIQIDHGFRKRFNIILKLEDSVNSNIAEKILGHSVTIPLDNAYLPAQDDRVIQKCFTEFKKAIPQLTISGTARKQAELDMMKEEKSKLEEEKDSLVDQSITIEQVKKELRQEIREEFRKDREELIRLIKTKKEIEEIIS